MFKKYVLLICIFIPLYIHSNNLTNLSKKVILPWVFTYKMLNNISVISHELGHFVADNILIKYDGISEIHLSQYEHFSNELPIKIIKLLGIRFLLYRDFFNPFSDTSGYYYKFNKKLKKIFEELINGFEERKILQQEVTNKESGLLALKKHYNKIKDTEFSEPILDSINSIEQEIIDLKISIKFINEKLNFNMKKFNLEEQKYLVKRGGVKSFMLNISGPIAGCCSRILELYILGNLPVKNKYLKLLILPIGGLVVSGLTHEILHGFTPLYENGDGHKIWKMIKRA